jgi:hypothetical protein
VSRRASAARASLPSSGGVNRGGALTRRDETRQARPHVPAAAGPRAGVERPTARAHALAQAAQAASGPGAGELGVGRGAVVVDGDDERVGLTSASDPSSSSKEGSPTRS